MYSVYEAPDDAHFRERLRDVDAEVRRVLAKTTPSYTSPPPLPSRAAHATTRSLDDAADVVAAAAGDKGTVYTTSTSWRAEVRRLCGVAVTQWAQTQLPAAIAAAVDERVARTDEAVATLAQSLRRAQEQHEHLAADVAALSQRCTQQLSTLQTAVDLVARQTRQRLDELQEQVQRMTGDVRADVALLKDSVGSLRSDAALTTQRAERRLDALAQQHNEAVHATLAEVEQRVRQWHRAVDAAVREAVCALQSRHDAMAVHVAQLQGGVDACAETASACATELRALLEDSATQRAAVRACRSDVNRLEMLVQCCGGGGGDVAATSSSALPLLDADEAATASSAPTSSSSLLLMQELLRSKERVSYLAGQLSSVEQRLAALEARQRHDHHHSGSSTAGNGGGGGGSHVMSDAHKTTTATTTTASRTLPHLDARQQYAPAPTSDSESERENQHLSRLALD